MVGETEKRAAFRIAHAALAKSGTVTLELALAGVPMIAAYRVGAAEALMASASKLAVRQGVFMERDGLMAAETRGTMGSFRRLK